MMEFGESGFPGREVRESWQKDQQARDSRDGKREHPKHRF